MTEEKRYCHYCDEVLKGRSDQIYCDDRCRNAYFNGQRKSEHKEIRAIDLALKKNRRILKEFLGTNKTINLGETELLQKGFDFRYHTHFFRTHAGELYWYCYEYGYLRKGSSRFMIVREKVPNENS